MQVSLNWCLKWTGESIETAKAYEEVAMAWVFKEQFSEAKNEFCNARGVYQKLGLDTSDTDFKIESIDKVMTGKYNLQYDILLDIMGVREAK